MSTQLRGRRSGAFWSLLFFLTVVAVAIGYFLGTQQSGAPLVQSVVAAQLATALAATLTAQPTPDPAATATSVAERLNTAVAATLTARPTVTQTPQPTHSPTLASNGIGSNPQLVPAPTLAVLATDDTINGCLGVVQVLLVNLTNGPGGTYGTVRTVYKGSSLRLVGRTASSTWFKVQDTRESWIRSDFITVQAGCTLPEIEPEINTSTP